MLALALDSILALTAWGPVLGARLCSCPKCVRRAKRAERLCCFDFVCSQFQSSRLSFVIIFLYSLVLLHFLLCFVLHALPALRALPIFLKRHTHFLRLCLRSKMTIHNPFKVTIHIRSPWHPGHRMRVAAAAEASWVRWPRNVAEI